MRALFVLGLSLFMILTSMLVTPRLSYAEESYAKELGSAISKFSDDEKAAGVTGCFVAIGIFPPAALICIGALVAGDIHDEIE